jgi:hypothetical protein
MRQIVNNLFHKKMLRLSTSAWRLERLRMKSHHKLLILLLGALLAPLLMGCTLPGTQPDDGIDPDFPVGSDAPSPVVPTPIEGPVIEGEARVQSLDILILESFPVQVMALVSGSLADGCTTISEADVAFDGSTYAIVMKTVRPQDMACTDALVQFEERVSLNVLGLPAGAYTVNAGELTRTFELAVDNVPPVDAGPGEAPGTINGLVFHDLCAVAGGEGGEPAVPSDGCVEPSANVFRADGINNDEPGIVGVEVMLGTGACPSTGLAAVITAADGSFVFENVAPGTYCVSVDPLAGPNESILVPGGWTLPADGTQGITVEQDAGASIGGIEFGWDYQFLPEAEDGGEAAGEGACTNEASFVDETIEDDTVIAAGQTFTKTWTLKNEGTCRWTKDYQVVFVNGHEMAGEATNLPAKVPPGEEITISVRLVAPNQEGLYRGDWMLQNENGRPFGLGDTVKEPFWVQIVVSGSIVDLDFGSPDWVDTFASGSNWFLVNNDQVRFLVEDGRMELRTKQSSVTDQWGISNQPDLRNFYIEGMFTTGDACVGLDRYGFIVRAPEPDRGYVVQLSCNGQYRVYVWDGKSYNALQEWTSHPSINTGPGQTNILGVLFDGKDMELYVNSVRITSFNDSNFNKGSFGLVVGSTNTDNFRVYVEKVSYWILDN